MCGRENDFTPAQLSAVETEPGRGDFDTLLRGICRSCGEPIDIQRSSEAPLAASTGGKAGTTEAVIAFAVLAVLLLLFIIAVLAMGK